MRLNLRNPVQVSIAGLDDQGLSNGGEQRRRWHVEPLPAGTDHALACEHWRGLSSTSSRADPRRIAIVGRTISVWPLPRLKDLLMLPRAPPRPASGP
jgi:hypothetical protein